MKRHITIPSSVTFKSIEGDLVKDGSGNQIMVPYWTFVTGRCGDPIFAHDPPNSTGSFDLPALMAIIEVQNAFRDKPPGSIASISEETWIRLDRSVRKGQYKPEACCLLEYCYSIINAKAVPDDQESY